MFFLLPVGVDYRASRQPMVTFSLIGACLVIFLLGLVAGLMGGREGFATWFLSLALIPQNGQFHAWITHLFMHAGLFHLLGNMAYLYLFGSCLEDILGRPRYLGFYLAGGLIAAFAEILAMPEHFASETPMVGASGAISACMGAFAVLLRKTKVEFRFVYFLFVTFGVREFFLPSWLILSLWFLNDLAGMLLSLGEGGGGVAFAAHVGGFLFGAAIGGTMRARGWRGDVDEEEPVPVAVPSFLPRARAQAMAVRVGESEPPSERTVYVWTSGAQAGPFPVSQVRRMRDLGALNLEDHFWDEAVQSWRPLGELA